MLPKLSVSIIYDFDRQTYTPGSNISGHIQVLVLKDEGVNIRGVKIYWTGKTHVSFRWRGSVYKREETHLENEMYIMGSGDKNSDTIPLAVGTHSIPFSIFLPPNIPGSFVKNEGYVAYNLKAKVNVPYYFDKHFSRPFNVAKTSVLPLSSAEPHTSTISRAFGFGCLNIFGNIQAEAMVNKIGFIGGESIYVTLKVKTSKRSVRRIYVELVQNVRFCGQRKRNRQKKNPIAKELKSRIALMTIEKGQLEPDVSVTYNDIVLPCNAGTQPSNTLELCNFIKMFYSVEVCFEVGLPFNTHKIFIPITIGTSSYQHALPQSAIAAQMSFGQVLPQPSYNPSILPQSTYNDAAPPYSASYSPSLAPQPAYNPAIVPLSPYDPMLAPQPSYNPDVVESYKS